jgi:hypothetical protein
MPINPLYRNLRDLLVQLRPTERETRGVHPKLRTTPLVNFSGDRM